MKKKGRGNKYRNLRGSFSPIYPTYPTCGETPSRKAAPSKLFTPCWMACGMGPGAIVSNMAFHPTCWVNAAKKAETLAPGPIQHSQQADSIQHAIQHGDRIQHAIQHGESTQQKTRPFDRASLFLLINEEET